MSLKMCGLLSPILVIGATDGLIKGIKKRMLVQQLIEGTYISTLPLTLIYLVTGTRHL